MILRLLLLAVGFLTCSVGAFANAASKDLLTTGNGVAAGLEPGMVYVQGFEHKIIRR